jgi:hypothetical protein
MPRKYSFLVVLLPNTSPAAAGEIGNKKNNPTLQHSIILSIRRFYYSPAVYFDRIFAKSSSIETLAMRVARSDIAYGMINLPLCAIAPQV